MPATSSKTVTARTRKKKAAEKALNALLEEDRDLFREVVLEAIEDFVLGELVPEGRKETGFVPRSEIFNDLQELQEIIAESREDAELLRAMRKGRKTKLVPREKVLETLRGNK